MVGPDTSDSPKGVLQFRAGKKLKMSARGHFESSKMSSKVCDFRQRETPQNEQLGGRSGKKLKMSARGHFEGSETSSKVRDFRHTKNRDKSAGS